MWDDTYVFDPVVINQADTRRVFQQAPIVGAVNTEIRHPIDPTVDARSFRLGSFGFANIDLEVPEKADVAPPNR